MAKGSEMSETSGIEIDVDGHAYKITRLSSYSREEFVIYVDFQGDYPVGGWMATWVTIPAVRYSRKGFIKLVVEAVKKEIEKDRDKHRKDQKEKKEREKSECFARQIADELGI